MALLELVTARWSMDLPMINSPTRFMTASMRLASTRRVLSATVATAEAAWADFAESAASPLSAVLGNNLRGLGIQKLAEEFVVGRLGACGALDANVGNDAWDTAALSKGVLWLNASKSGFDDFDGCGSEVVFGAKGDKRSATMQDVSNELKRGGTHEAVGINAQRDVVNRLATMNSFGDHELLVFGPGEVRGTEAGGC